MSLQTSDSPVQAIPERSLIDICLIAGARPQLLARTLDSFKKRLISKLTVSKVIANVDLFGGSEEDRAQCVQLIAHHFPGAQISTPLTPHFTAAVKHVWAQTTQATVLHLEDDWLLLDDLEPHAALSMLSETTRAVKFLSREHNQDLRRDGEFDIGWIRKKVLGLTWRKEPYNRHGTSPGFFDGDFVRGWALKMDLSLDPEKQTRPPWNPQLFNYVNQFSCRFIAGKNQSPLIEDIGRAWRDDQGLIKHIVDGRSEWESLNAGESTVKRPPG